MIFINYYKVAAYIRLSREDVNKKYDEKSESVINQINLINKYIQDNNLLLYDKYIDDGYSGTNFDRPGFERMLKDIEDGNVNMIITKDLSRLGRDYIKCGYYLEEYFPSKKVRYVSILDNIDTLLDSYTSDLLPFKSLFNDLQSKDTSRKIKSILRNKKQQGLFLGNSASFGYLKSPMDKHKLIVDPVSSLIVKYIFFLALTSKSLKEICDYLNLYNVPTPLKYKKLRECSLWTTSSIHNILTNYMYTGNLVQGIQKKLSYKSKKRIKTKKNEWIICNDTHEPIISKKLFDIVNNINRKVNARDKLLLEGLIYCKECKSLMSVRQDKRGSQVIYNLNCNSYCKSGGKYVCTSHFIKYDSVLNYVAKSLNLNINKLSKEYITSIIKGITISKNKEIEIIYL